ncbi:NAD(P)H-dependent oxidoreductase [Mycoplasmatota bacterium WC44]
MEKVLILNANSKSRDYSRTAKIADAFTNAYRESNQYHEITKVDLYELDNPDIDKDVMAAIGYLRSDGDFNILGEEVKSKLRKRTEILEQFKSADKIVLSAPMWDLSNPSVVKKWIDTIVVSDETFKYTEKGPVGLVKDKKVLFIQTTGGDYSKMPGMNFGLNHFKAIMNFLGISDFTSIVAYGMDVGLEELNLQEAINEAINIAKKF